MSDMFEALKDFGRVSSIVVVCHLSLELDDFSVYGRGVYLVNFTGSLFDTDTITSLAQLGKEAAIEDISGKADEDFDVLDGLVTPTHVVISGPDVGAVVFDLSEVDDDC